MIQFQRLSRYLPLLVILVAAVIAVAGYLQGLNYPFVNDDTIYITENTTLAGLQFSGLWRLFVEPYNAYEFLPLRDLSYWLDMQIGHLTPAVYRLDNILLYVLSLPLVYSVTAKLWKYFRPADAATVPWAAAAVTTLFALHPAHVESVVWIASRKDVLSSLFSLLALRLAFAAKHNEGISPGFAVATLTTLMAAMLSKATAIATAPIIALLWLLFWKDVPLATRGRIQLFWPIASLLLAALFVMLFSGSSTVRLDARFGMESVTRALAILGWLGRLFISPEHRLFYHPVLEDPSLGMMSTLGLLLILATGAGLLLVLRKRSFGGFLMFSFGLLCFPYLQLLPYRTHSLVSDRFLTLALWPAVLLFVVMIWSLNVRLRAIILLCISLLWGFQTQQRTHDWNGYEALMDADLKIHPGNYLPAFQKIMSYQLPKGRFDDAIQLANGITFPEARAIMIKLVEVAIDLRDVRLSGDPRNTMGHLMQLEPLLLHPPERAKWDPAMLHFWKVSKDSYVLEWQWLVKSCPDDPSVREQARISLSSVIFE